MEKLILKDNTERNYEVDDSKRFLNHLLEFHTLNGKANNSIHEENGFYFTVTSEMLEKLISFVKKLK